MKKELLLAQRREEERAAFAVVPHVLVWKGEREDWRKEGKKRKAGGYHDRR